MRILVLSDNHGDRHIIDKILQQEVFDVAIHLGDSELSEEWVKNRFQYYVCGNHDMYEPMTSVVELDGIKYALCHGHTEGISVFRQDQPAYHFGHRCDADAVLHGHTHIFKDQMVKDIRVICPGSTSLSRGPEGNGYCIITSQPGKIISVEFKGV